VLAACAPYAPPGHAVDEEEEEEEEDVARVLG